MSESDSRDIEDGQDSQSDYDSQDSDSSFDSTGIKIESNAASSVADDQSDTEMELEEGIEAGDGAETESNDEGDKAELILTETESSSDDEMDNFGLTKSDKAETTQSPDQIVLQQIVDNQAETGLLIRRRPFERLIREILADFSDDLRFERKAAEALQTAAENYLAGLFDHARKIAFQVGGENQEIVSDTPSRATEVERWLTKAFCSRTRRSSNCHCAQRSAQTISLVNGSWAD